MSETKVIVRVLAPYRVVHDGKPYAMTTHSPSPRTSAAMGTLAVGRTRQQQKLTNGVSVPWRQHLPARS